LLDDPFGDAHGGLHSRIVGGVDRFVDDEHMMTLSTYGIAHPDNGSSELVEVSL